MAIGASRGSMTRRGLMHGGLGAVLLPPLIVAAPAQSGSHGARPYTDPTILAKLPFGTHSHLLQPWRSYLETVPATRFLHGIGIVLDSEHPVAEAAIEMLARNGVAHARLEIGWGKLKGDEYNFAGADSFTKALASCRRWGLRPLILLNAHHGLPAPAEIFARTVIEGAPAGARRLRVDSVSGIEPGRSGLCDLSEFWAAEILVTELKGNRLFLSKPLPKPIAAGTTVKMATLKYEPFSVPGSLRNETTIMGWLRYVDATAEFVAAALGTAGEDDVGFDLEIWNELSFGTKFLSINNYYDPKPYSYREDEIWTEIVARTAEHVGREARRFAGVLVTNGFGSTVPWPASSRQPERIAAISKHPYPQRRTFPADERGTRAVDLDGRPTAFVPSYKAWFPEYGASAIQTETIVRDMGPITSAIYGVDHGRFARKLETKTVPVEVWITEIGILPSEAGVTDPETALRLKAKAATRFVLFYLQKGAGRVYLFSAFGGDLGTGILTERFLQYVRTRGYPDDDASWRSPALTAIGRIAGRMREGLDTTFESTRALDFAVWDEPGSAVQFEGGGTKATPPLRNVDALVLLPFQINRSRFAVGYYVVTKDLAVPMSPEMIRVDIDGLNSRNIAASAYDPVADTGAPIEVAASGQHGVTISLVATDTPRLLFLEES
jgi:hypothetical protein